jgi:hypothetical protein
MITRKLLISLMKDEAGITSREIIETLKKYKFDFKDKVVLVQLNHMVRQGFLERLDHINDPKSHHNTKYEYKLCIRPQSSTL